MGHGFKHGMHQVDTVLHILQNIIVEENRNLSRKTGVPTSRSS